MLAMDNDHNGRGDILVYAAEESHYNDFRLPSRCTQLADTEAFRLEGTVLASGMEDGAKDVDVGSWRAHIVNPQDSAVLADAELCGPSCRDALFALLDAHGELRSELRLSEGHTAGSQLPHEAAGGAPAVFSSKDIGTGGPLFVVDHITVNPNLDVDDASSVAPTSLWLMLCDRMLGALRTLAVAKSCACIIVPDNVWKKADGVLASPNQAATAARGAGFRRIANTSFLACVPSQLQHPCWDTSQDDVEPSLSIDARRFLQGHELWLSQAYGFNVMVVSDVGSTWATLRGHKRSMFAPFLTQALVKHHGLLARLAQLRLSHVCTPTAHLRVKRRGFCTVCGCTVGAGGLLWGVITPPSRRAENTCHLCLLELAATPTLVLPSEGYVITRKHGQDWASLDGEPFPDTRIVRRSRALRSALESGIDYEAADRRKGRHPFSQQEVRNLLHGIARYGSKAWSKIYAVYEFSRYRKSADLVDKWRGLIRPAVTRRNNPMRHLSEEMQRMGHRSDAVESLVLMYDLDLQNPHARSPESWARSDGTSESAQADSEASPTHPELARDAHASDSDDDGRSDSVGGHGHHHDDDNSFDTDSGMESDDVDDVDVYDDDGDVEDDVVYADEGDQDFTNSDYSSPSEDATTSPTSRHSPRLRKEPPSPTRGSPRLRKPHASPNTRSPSRKRNRSNSVEEAAAQPSPSKWASPRVRGGNDDEPRLTEYARAEVLQVLTETRLFHIPRRRRRGHHVPSRITSETRVHLKVAYDQYVEEWPTRFPNRHGRPMSFDYFVEVARLFL